MSSKPGPAPRRPDAQTTRADRSIREEPDGVRPLEGGVPAADVRSPIPAAPPQMATDEEDDADLSLLRAILDGPLFS